MRGPRIQILVNAPLTPVLESCSRLPTPYAGRHSRRELPPTHLPTRTCLHCPPLPLPDAAEPLTYKRDEAHHSRFHAIVDIDVLDDRIVHALHEYNTASTSHPTLISHSPRRCGDTFDTIAGKDLLLDFRFHTPPSSTSSTTPRATTASSRRHAPHPRCTRRPPRRARLRFPLHCATPPTPSRGKTSRLDFRFHSTLDHLVDDSSTSASCHPRRTQMERALLYRQSCQDHVHLADNYRVVHAVIRPRVTISAASTPLTIRASTQGTATTSTTPSPPASTTSKSPISRALRRPSTLSRGKTSRLTCACHHFVDDPLDRCFARATTRHTASTPHTRQSLAYGVSHPTTYTEERCAPASTIASTSPTTTALSTPPFTPALMRLSTTPLTPALKTSPSMIIASTAPPRLAITSSPATVSTSTASIPHRGNDTSITMGLRMPATSGGWAAEADGADGRSEGGSRLGPAMTRPVRAWAQSPSVIFARGVVVQDSGVPVG
ncbi:hypothetical protein C8J57DRAFT_1492399 [Mycena rebaudengoi]|nr:hypothetical protein C8J57DRAFT_1492399 [Mycena rebaudengoi]